MSLRLAEQSSFIHHLRSKVKKIKIKGQTQSETRRERSALLTKPKLILMCLLHFPHPRASGTQLRLRSGELLLDRVREDARRIVWATQVVLHAGHLLHPGVYLVHGLPRVRLQGGVIQDTSRGLPPSLLRLVKCHCGWYVVDGMCLSASKQLLPLWRNG